MDPSLILCMTFFAAYNAEASVPAMCMCISRRLGGTSNSLLAGSRVRRDECSRLANVES
jgi:hypothetical protein